MDEIPMSDAQLMKDLGEIDREMKLRKKQRKDYAYWVMTEQMAAFYRFNRRELVRQKRMERNTTGSVLLNDE